MVKTIVETKYGKTQGIEENGVYVWKGIPYAMPPIGHLRFQEPQDCTTWKGIYDATEFGPISLQPNNPVSKLIGSEENNTSEDCLYLNVWAPDVNDEKKPVVVWIHGGGFWFDSGSNPFYDGSSFAKNGDVVFVTINYRLGPLGFLHLGDFGGEKYAASGNCGLLDQVKALQWVKENISAFGGDPERITIAGESAGGTSVAMLMGMPAAQGLFKQAILQSFSGDIYFKPKDATELTLKFLSILGLKPTEISKLETLHSETLIEAANSLRSSEMQSAVFQPVIDGRYLPYEPLEAIKRGISKNISVLIGTNKDEYRLHTALGAWDEMDDEQVENYARIYLGSTWSEVSNYYLDGVKTGKQLRDSVISAISSTKFFIPAVKLSEFQVQNGAPVWMYRFDWETPTFNGKLGACHFLEIPFVFNNLDQPNAILLTGNSTLRKEIGNQMHFRWIEFVKKGNPNLSGAQDWPSYNLITRSTMIFDDFCISVNDPNQKERKSWENVIVSK